MANGTQYSFRVDPMTLMESPYPSFDEAIYFVYMGYYCGAPRNFVVYTRSQALLEDTSIGKKFKFSPTAVMLPYSQVFRCKEISTILKFLDNFRTKTGRPKNMEGFKQEVMELI
jgi:hypothetical protein